MEPATWAWLWSNHNLPLCSGTPKQLSYTSQGNFFLILIFHFSNEGRERNIYMKNIDWLPSLVDPTWDQTCNAGTCPNQNWTATFGLWGDAEPAEPHWPVCQTLFKIMSFEWHYFLLDLWLPLSLLHSELLLAVYTIYTLTTPKCIFLASYFHWAPIPTCNSLLPNCYLHCISQLSCPKTGHFITSPPNLLLPQFSPSQEMAFSFLLSR